AGYEERCCEVRSTVFDLPVGESGSRKGKRIVTTLRSSQLKVGPHHNGPCMRTTQDTRRTRHYMGSRRPIDQSSTFHSHSAKLSDRQAERLVHPRRSAATWSPLIYRFKQRSQVHIRLLGKSTEVVRHSTSIKHGVSPTNGR